MFNFLKNFFPDRSLDGFKLEVEEINALEAEVLNLSSAELKSKSDELRIKLREEGETPTSRHLAFALVREAAKRTLGQRPFDVQLLGGLVLHKGAVAEMSTGEGKTLSAVAPAYFNALFGQGVHVVTVNDYLARRDVAWMGQVYHALGLTVSCIVPGAAYMYDPEWKIPEGTGTMIDQARDTTGSFLVQQDFLRPISRREAYLADITYGTNHEFGFDYLRDNLVQSVADQAQRPHYYVIIDEVDSILIDEARTPLIIAAPDAQSSEYYKTFARVVRYLVKDEDYTVDEKLKNVRILDSGIEKVEKALSIKNIYTPENLRLVHYLEESLKAHALFRKDKEYVVKNGEILIVDEFTGRLLHGRRYNGGLHQAIEAKEGVFVKEESRTYAKISIQNYFRLYNKIGGMTGTAQTSAEEFHKVYELEVVSIPTNRPLAREDMSDAIYKNSEIKWNAVVNKVEELYQKGQPVLLGTTSIEKNELLSRLLNRAGVPHEVLNAKNNEREGSIVAQAGRYKAVTVATNMAGRGVDVILGGNPPDPEMAKKVRELGGLFVIGTERHEARRIDNQLRGRSGRQGDPGASQFFLSLDDDLMRIFGGERVQSLMSRFNLPDDLPIDLPMVSRVVSEAQAKVEGSYFDMRKHLLEYDDVLNKQRIAVYKRRSEILTSFEKQVLTEKVEEAVLGQLEKFASQLEIVENPPEFWEELKTICITAKIIPSDFVWPEQGDLDPVREEIKKKAEAVASNPQTINQLLGTLDMLWLNHLENNDALSESIGLRAYGQRDPLVEYRRESHRLFTEFWDMFNAWVFENIFRLANDGVQAGSASPMIHIPAPKESLKNADGEKVGRNDPCPCGSGKKYKHCHGK